MDAPAHLPAEVVVARLVAVGGGSDAEAGHRLAAQHGVVDEDEVGIGHRQPVAHGVRPQAAERGVRRQRGHLVEQRFVEQQAVDVDPAEVGAVGVEQQLPGHLVVGRVLDVEQRPVAAPAQPLHLLGRQVAADQHQVALRRIELLHLDRPVGEAAGEEAVDRRVVRRRGLHALRVEAAEVLPDRFQDAVHRGLAALGGRVAGGRVAGAGGGAADGGLTHRVISLSDLGVSGVRTSVCCGGPGRNGVGGALPLQAANSSP